MSCLHGCHHSWVGVTREDAPDSDKAGGAGVYEEDGGFGFPHRTTATAAQPTEGKKRKMGNKQASNKNYKKDKYVGDMKDNRAHGKGKLVYSVKDKAGRVSYKGFFVHGQKQGEGMMTWRDGRTYMGAWWADEMHGRGTMLYDAESAHSYEGEWMSGKRHGMGQMKYAADDRQGRVCYFGPWVCDKKEGNGYMEWRSGAKYLGEFRAGKRHGHGVFMFPNGDQFLCQWCDGRPCGVGRIIFADGTQCEGFWINAETWEKTRTMVFRNARN